jgi:hypothetical protein
MLEHAPKALDIAKYSKLKKGKKLLVKLFKYKYIILKLFIISSNLSRAVCPPGFSGCLIGEGAHG